VTAAGVVAAAVVMGATVAGEGRLKLATSKVILMSMTVILQLLIQKM